MTKYRISCGLGILLLVLAPFMAFGALSSSSSAESGNVDADGGVRVTLQPRGGISEIRRVEGFSAQSRYAVGGSLGIGVSDYITFDMGYTFTEYGVAMANGSTLLQNYQNIYNYYGYGGYNYSSYNQNLETMTMKQHVADAGLKLYFLSPSFRLRPFIGGGAAYSRNFVNYDPRLISLLQSVYPNLNSNYEVAAYMGYVSAGFDVILSKSVAIGTVLKYYRVLSAKENQQFNDTSLYNNGGSSYPYGGYSSYGYGGAYNMGDTNAEKRQIGSSIARADFYSVLVGLSLTF